MCAVIVLDAGRGCTGCCRWGSKCGGGNSYEPTGVFWCFIKMYFILADQFYCSNSVNINRDKL